MKHKNCIKASTEYFDVIKCKSGNYAIYEKETGRVNTGWLDLEAAHEQALLWDEQMEEYGEVIGY